MKTPRLLVFALVLSFAVSGCAQKRLWEVDRTAYGRIAFDPKIEKPKRYGYSDATMQGTAAVTGNFGLVGGLVGIAALAAQEASGRRRMDPVVAAARVDPVAVVRERIRHHVEAMRIFETRSANPDAKFVVRIVNWGFTNGGPDRLAAGVVLEAKMIDRADKIVWSQQAFGTSSRTAPITEFQANPKLFAETFREAVDVCCRKFTTEWE